MTIIATAPGKLLLVGEHAVVYGYPCIVTTVDLRYRVVLEPHPNDTVSIITPQLSTPRTVPLLQVGENPPRETAFVEAVIARFRDDYGLAGGFTLTTAGPSISYGLGSSSAVTAAVAVAVDKLMNIGLDRRGLFDLCYGAVLDVQGRGSGFDVASALYGGTIYYQNDPLAIDPLDVDVSPVIIGYSGRKVGTVNLVAGVAALRETYPTLIEPIFETAGRTVERARDMLITGDWSAFGALVNINSGLTDALGVNTSKLSAMVYAAREAGALGAKLSGAGGGDCMFAVTSSNTRQVVETAIAAAGGRVLPLALGVPGAQVET